eukprot:TRINITY_DN55214_c0_g1_i1.p1 TRINITY_DN55214_c0_g1~~TRINITY_DN55214_c0_g1_i1.p1  ORF type:complete len:239 (-),score=36.47 TRINITY_DN55214_c0_g1_i1:371-1087(-)
MVVVHPRRGNVLLFSLKFAVLVAFSSWLGSSLLNFVVGWQTGGSRQSLVARRVRATGKTRVPPETDVTSLWRVDPKTFKYGWDSEKGYWVDIPPNMIKKWWQQPSYLTPFGYRQPPHWTKKDYELACFEMKLSGMEADYIADLKLRGMTIEEIRDRARSYEFIDNPEFPKPTPKLMFLMQVKCMHDGRDEELIDVGEVWKPLTQQAAKEVEMTVAKQKQLDDLSKKISINRKRSDISA